jgi:hypothetical protein
MARSRVPSPKDKIKIRRLPAQGSTIQLSATVTKVHEGDHPLRDKITLQIPGYPIPVTLSAASLLGEDE